MKKKIGKLIPYPVIENGRKIVHAGTKRCVVCRAHIRHYLDTGYGFEVLERLQVVGGLRRTGDMCPICHSSSRERLVWFWLTDGGGQFRFGRDCRIAHFAPEKGLTKRLSEASDRYQPYDFDPSRYRHLTGVKQADLTDLDIADGSLDLVLCNHVLEHVPDLPKAMSELLRAMSPGATAILQVPIALQLDDPVELSVDSTPEERVRLTGQDDHLRLMTQPYYVEHLRKAGFEVELYQPFAEKPQAATDWRLDPFETLFVCRKPA